MRDYWLTQEILKGIGFAYIALTLLALALALWLPKRWWGKLVAVAVVIGIFSILPRQAQKEIARDQVKADEFKVRYDKAKALFDERCKTAGEKIYMTVDSVEGVLLMNIRADNKAANRANPNWPDAALPDEAGGDDFIRHFLYWEHNPDKLNGRGYLNANAERSVSEGYKYVEVIQPDSTVIQYTLDKSDSTKLSPLKESKPKARYAVGFVNLIDPEDRNHWIAGTVITITDTRTDEVIARRQSYSFEPGLGSIAGFRSPWGFAVTCPRLLSWHERYPTRFFIDQILKPIQGV